MDFFTRQARSQRLTRILLVQFSIAVLAIVLALNGLAYGLHTTWVRPSAPGFGPWLASGGWMVTLPVILLFAIGSLHRASQLRRGAGYLAVLAGGRLVATTTSDPLERRLLHVTEEMSLASGAAVPRVYVLPQEAGINAFVSGRTLHDTALVVTRGALENLDRDELQAVVGHEFSHILHQDLQLNARLLALLGGIQMLPTLGRHLLGQRATRAWSGHAWPSRSNLGQPAAALIGLILLVVGYLGLFAARLLQAAIARQREFHADASAVQFTRLPDALAGALQRIMTTPQQSYLHATALAQEINHMCFGASVALRRWLGSHPPLEDRIVAIDPLFPVRARQRARRQARQQANQGADQHPDLPVRDLDRRTPRQSPMPTPEQTPRQPPDQAASTFAGPASRTVGQLHDAQTHWAADTRSRLAARFDLDAATVEQLEALLLTFLRGDWAALDNLEEELRLPLLELLAGRLRQATESVSQEAFATLCQAAEASRGEPLATFCHLAFLERQFLPPPRRGAMLKDYRRVRRDLGLLLSLFARLGCGGEQPEVVFASVARHGFPLDPLDYCSTITAAALRGALERLAHLAPILKPAVLDACAETVMHDGRILTREYEMLRVAAVLLDCPMPPRVPAR